MAAAIAASFLAAASPVAAFTKLGEEFAIEDRVILWLTSADGLHATNLDDFLHSVATEQALALIPL